MNKFLIMLAAPMLLSLAACDSDDSPKGPARKVFHADEFCSALEAGEDIIVPAGTVIDLTSRTSGDNYISIKNPVEVRVDGEVTGICNYIEIYSNLEITGSGSISGKAPGLLYLHSGELDIEGVTLRHTANDNSGSGSAIFLFNGEVDLDRVSIYSDLRCIYVSQMSKSSTIDAEDCSFFSTATNVQWAYAIDIDGKVDARFEDCDNASTFGNLSAFGSGTNVTIQGGRYSVLQPTSGKCNYNIQSAGKAVVNIDPESYKDGRKPATFFSQGSHTLVADNEYNAGTGSFRLSGGYYTHEAWNAVTSSVILSEPGTAWEVLPNSTTVLTPAAEQMNVITNFVIKKL